MSSQSLTTGFLVDAASPLRHGGGVRTNPLRRRNRPHRAGPWTILLAAYRRHRSRAALVGLDAYALKDIGVSFAEAEHEANKPFWRS